MKSKYKTISKLLENAEIVNEDIRNTLMDYGITHKLKDNQLEKFNIEFQKSSYQGCKIIKSLETVFSAPSKDKTKSSILENKIFNLLNNEINQDYENHMEKYLQNTKDLLEHNDLESRSLEQIQKKMELSLGRTRQKLAIDRL